MKTEREILVKGFHYDGECPVLWFYAMKRGFGGEGISISPSNSIDTNYYTLSYHPGAQCQGIEAGWGWRDTETDIILNLPVNADKLESIGLFCYVFCKCYGHVIIPQNFKVTTAPPNLTVIKPCLTPPDVQCHPFKEEINSSGCETALLTESPHESVRHRAKRQDAEPTPPPPSTKPPPREPPPPSPPKPTTEPPIKPPPSPPEPRPQPDSKSKGITIPVPIVVGIIIILLIVVVIGGVLGWRMWSVNRVHDVGVPFRVA